MMRSPRETVWGTPFFTMAIALGAFPRRRSAARPPRLSDSTQPLPTEINPLPQPAPRASGRLRFREAPFVYARSRLVERRFLRGRSR
jgi:hypothetical protein